MEIISFDELPSTQLYLIEKIRNGDITESVAIITNEQLDGIGSRNNKWDGGKGNFFASVAVKLDVLPEDLPIQTASIYFSYLMKESLGKITEEVWLKWPNDIYQNEQKVGGVVTQKLKDFLVVGIGVNLKKHNNSYGALDTDTEPLILLNIFLDKLSGYPNWKQILSKYKVEFEEHRAYFFHHDSAKMSLRYAELCDDGSLQINDERIYSLR